MHSTIKGKSPAFATHSPTTIRLRSSYANYAEYERRKAAWVATNSVASHAEYDFAMRRIARECGV